MKKLLFSTVFLLLSIVGYSQVTQTVGKEAGRRGPFRVVVRILDEKNGEELIGVNTIIENNGMGTISDLNGESVFDLKRGVYSLKLSYVGYRTKYLKIDVVGDGEIITEMEETQTLLGEVVITSRSMEENVKSAEIGKNELNVSMIESLPLYAGEVDVIKSLTLLPGVSTVGEASSGLNVRGGGADQNLILLGGAPIYNPSHLFGFFSSVNSDVINNVSLYKGGVPSKYGGRSSSILDIQYKNGNLDKWEGKATAGLVSSKLFFDGPIVKDKLSLIGSIRGSYVNWMLGMANDLSIKNSSAAFYDANAILTYRLSEDSKLDYTFYQSYDDFNLASDTVFSWANQNHVLNWDYSITDNMFLKTYGVVSRYNIGIRNDPGITGFELESVIDEKSVNVDYLYNITDNNSINAGFNVKYYTINPGSLDPKGNGSTVEPVNIQDEQALESSAYIQHTLDIGKRISLNYGVRFTNYDYLGPNDVYTYDEFQPRRIENSTGEESFGNNKVIENYRSILPRFALRLSFTETSSIKLGFNRMNQFINLISNTATVAPTDIWKLSDRYIKPTDVYQYSVGLFKNIGTKYELSVEGYYKDIRNIVEYKDGAVLFLNDHLETELLNGEGEAYGVEFYAKKNGRLSGWLSYTYSRSLRRVPGTFQDELINNGDWFPSNFDKPHDITAVANYSINSKTKFSAIFTYSTGRPVTFPGAKFNSGNELLPYYDTRNQFRAPDYHRLDISFTWTLNGAYKWTQGDFVFSVYNLYGRDNAFSVFFDDVRGAEPQAYQLTVLGSPFPSISYSFDLF